MKEEKILCGVYMRVSTEDQAREGFSLPEQKERLEMYCKFNSYQIVEYYTDAGISAKTGNKRPEFDRMLEDGKNGRINMIIALKLDRKTRSIRDWEMLMDYSDKYNVALAFVNDKIDTTNANGKMVSRIMMSVSQNEIERTSERTIIGLEGAIKQGHIPHRAPLGYKHVDKKLLPDLLTKDYVIRIYDLYLEGMTYNNIAKLYNNEKVKGLKQEISNLENEVSDLTENKESINKEITTLNKNKDDIKVEIDKKKKLNKKIVIKSKNQLWEENDKLKEENDHLKTLNYQYEQQYKSLKEETDYLVKLIKKFLDKMPKIIKDVISHVFDGAMSLSLFKRQYDNEYIPKERSIFNIFNKKEIDKVSKNINYEMEESAEEFYTDKKDKEKDDELSL